MGGGCIALHSVRVVSCLAVDSVCAVRRNKRLEDDVKGRSSRRHVYSLLAGAVA